MPFQATKLFDTFRGRMPTPRDQVCLFRQLNYLVPLGGKRLPLWTTYTFSSNQTTRCLWGVGHLPLGTGYAFLGN